jgi:hypothetical protein
VYVEGKITTIEELVGNYWQLESKNMVFNALKNAKHLASILANLQFQIIDE